MMGENNEGITMILETKYRRQALQRWEASCEKTKQEIEADFCSVKAYLHSLWNYILHFNTNPMSKKRCL